MAIPRQTSTFDERRNTSRVIPVPPGMVQAGLVELTAFRRFSPAHAAWIEEGYPTLTEEQHVARFGELYGGRRR